MSRLEELVEPARVLADLDSLEALTADADGAQRVAWTDAWKRARLWLEARLEELGIEPSIDAAGNLWAAPAGARPPYVAVGSHLDSVPDGGRLDGALGVVAALELLRAAVALGDTSRGVILVDFADEEGARFGHSLFGSTALVGRLGPAVAELRDSDGVALADALAACGISVAEANTASGRLDDLLAYVELHIEQGPELAASHTPIAAVAGATGIRRLVARVSGQSTHAGATAMGERRDPMVVAAEAITSIGAAASEAGGLATFGSLRADPAIATAVPATVELTIDLRHGDAAELRRLLASAEESIRGAASRHRCEAELRELWRMEPVTFDPALVDAAEAAASWTGAEPTRLLSGRGHDAVVVAERVPTTMLFCPSERGGLSHNAREHTEPADIEQSVRALARLVGQLATGEVVPSAARANHDQKEKQ